VLDRVVQPSRLHAVITEMLAARGHTQPVADDDSLFFSGLLDSLAATEVMMLLEAEFGIDVADADFDITQLDTLESMQAMIASRG
jgi:acyl carrier protein